MVLNSVRPQASFFYAVFTETAAMRRFIRWLRVWEKKAEAEQDGSLLRSASGPSSPLGSPRTPKLASDETQGAEVPRKPSLAFPGPVTLLRQAEEWFCSTEKQNAANYRNVRFAPSCRSTLSVPTSVSGSLRTDLRLESMQGENVAP